MNNNYVLSSGCFTNYEERFLSYTKKQIPAIELTGHNRDGFEKIISHCKKEGMDIKSVHTPIPQGKTTLNIGCHLDRYKEVEHAVLQYVSTASDIGVNYVLFHAFYTFENDLPSGDIERIRQLDTLTVTSDSINAYVESKTYKNGIKNVIRNLKGMMPKIRAVNNKAVIILENLTPRIGYGGLFIKDLKHIADQFDGDVGICLDMGHLHLTGSVFGMDLTSEIVQAREHILSSHIHQNFSGCYAVDRKWNEEHAQPGLQDVDIHMPLTGKYQIIGAIEPSDVYANNAPFKEKLKGVVQFAPENNLATTGSVPWGKWTEILDKNTIRILELDSRYAPLDYILQEYQECNRCGLSSTE